MDAASKTGDVVHRYFFTEDRKALDRIKWLQIKIKVIYATMGWQIINT